MVEVELAVLHQWVTHLTRHTASFYRAFVTASDRRRVALCFFKHLMSLRVALDYKGRRRASWYTTHKTSTALLMERRKEGDKMQYTGCQVKDLFQNQGNV